LALLAVLQHHSLYRAIDALYEQLPIRKPDRKTGAFAVIDLDRTIDFDIQAHLAVHVNPTLLQTL
jgi:hypothetical protein